MKEYLWQFALGAINAFGVLTLIGFLGLGCFILFVVYLLFGPRILAPTVERLYHYPDSEHLVSGLGPIRSPHWAEPYSLSWTPDDVEEVELYFGSNGTDTDMLRLYDLRSLDIASFEFCSEMYRGMVRSTTDQSQVTMCEYIYGLPRSGTLIWFGYRLP